MISHNSVEGERVEFFKAWEIYRSDVALVEATAHGDLHHHRHDEFQPVIPWQVALQQSLPPLHRLELLCGNFSHCVNCILTSKKGTFLMWRNRGHF